MAVTQLENSTGVIKCNSSAPVADDGQCNPGEHRSSLLIPISAHLIDDWDLALPLDLQESLKAEWLNLS